MSTYDRLHNYYHWNWIDSNKLKMYVQYKQITAEQYEQITGIPYTV